MEGEGREVGCALCYNVWILYPIFLPNIVCSDAIFSCTMLPLYPLVSSAHPTDSKHVLPIRWASSRAGRSTRMWARIECFFETDEPVASLLPLRNCWCCIAKTQPSDRCTSFHYSTSLHTSTLYLILHMLFIHFRTNDSQPCNVVLCSWIYSKF